MEFRVCQKFQSAPARLLHYPNSMASDQAATWNKELLSCIISPFPRLVRPALLITIYCRPCIRASTLLTPIPNGFALLKTQTVVKRIALVSCKSISSYKFVLLFPLYDFLYSLLCAEGKHYTKKANHFSQCLCAKRCSIFIHKAYKLVDQSRSSVNWIFFHLLNGSRNGNKSELRWMVGDRNLNEALRPTTIISSQTM